MYARGKIPGSFFRREGRPSTHAVLIDRLIDRPIRPLFPKGFRNEVQVIVTPLSTDLTRPMDIMALIGASSTLCISDIPFDGPLSATRIGYIDGQFIVNPTYEDLEKSLLDLVVAGNRDGVSMMEAAANELPEDIILEAIEMGQDTNLQLIDLQEKMTEAIGKEKTEYEYKGHSIELSERVRDILEDKVSDALRDASSDEDTKGRLKTLELEVSDTLSEEHSKKDIAGAFRDIVDNEFRERILNDGLRPDNRGLKELRPISCEVGLLPRTHGTGLFSRGETQVLSVATLGSSGDAQKVDNMSPEETKRFMLHYNFPPYSVGEVRRVGSPGRREIGHGALAERALGRVIPDESQFPYTVRLVAEVLSSNGSTSMGSVCASTLALMDAGVPIKAPIAGISIGLITGKDGHYATLTDIQGLEDHVGDMDFKVAGSSEGITAIQLDIKIKGITYDMIQDALSQAKEARISILGMIREAIAEVRNELSPHAPRMERISIPVSKIGSVIGPGGKTIRAIVEATKATVDIEDDGTVTIGSSDAEASKKAIQMVKDLTREVEIGEIFTGKVVKTTPFGAFVTILPGTDGLVHISELANYRVPSVEEIVTVGEEITVAVIGKDPAGKIKLSRRALLDSEDKPTDLRDEASTPQRSPGYRNTDRQDNRRPDFQRRSHGPKTGPRDGSG